MSKPEPGSTEVTPHPDDQRTRSQRILSDPKLYEEFEEIFDRVNNSAKALEEFYRRHPDLKPNPGDECVFDRNKAKLFANLCHVEMLFGRDLEPIDPFQLQGRPHIDETEDFKLVTEKAGKLSQYTKKSGRPADRDPKAVARAVELNKTMGRRKISEKDRLEERVTRIEILLASVAELISPELAESFRTLMKPD